MPTHEQPRVGVVSFTDPRPTAQAEPRERYIEARHAALVDHLQQAGFAVVDPMPRFREGWTEVYGLNQTAEVLACADYLVSEGIDCLVQGCWHWTDPYLGVHLAARTNVPTALFCENDPAWAGSVLVSSISAGLRETVPNRHALTHQRFRGEKERLTKWVRGVAALQQMRRSSLVLWGGTYSLRMEHLQDDIPRLKSFLIGDVWQEDQYILIQKAERMLAANDPAIDRQIDWLAEQGASIEYDGGMLTAESFRRQVALYLAARERLAELAGEKVAGASIKCQPEVMTYWGATGCTLPAFLPFGCDYSGEQPIMPTVCEGDIKGLLSCVLLHKIHPAAPPLFGDVKYIGDDFWLLSNCGAASVFYARNSLDPAVTLPHVRIRGNCHGASGGAIGYFGQPGPLTLARLIRIHGRYQMQLGLGEAIPVGEEVQARIMFGEMWPLHAITLPSNLALFFEAVGANHFSATPGDFTAEVAAACREAQIPVFRIDDDGDLRRAVESATSGG